MNPRLPAKCSGCGTRVELRIGEFDVFTHRGWIKPPRPQKLPPVWCDVASNEPHVCAQIGGNLGGHNSGPEALFAPPARATTKEP